MLRVNDPWGRHIYSGEAVRTIPAPGSPLSSCIARRHYHSAAALPRARRRAEQQSATATCGRAGSRTSRDCAATGAQNATNDCATCRIPVGGFLGSCSNSSPCPLPAYGVLYLELLKALSWRGSPRTLGPFGQKLPRMSVLFYHFPCYLVPSHVATEKGQPSSSRLGSFSRKDSTRWPPCSNTSTLFPLAGASAHYIPVPQGPP